MGITSGIVLFTIIWFMVFFVVLPLKMESQGDAGDVVPGTPSSAPSDPQIGRKAKIATLWAAGIFAIVAGVILSGIVTIDDLDWAGRMGLRP